jgi:hypothetical protein
MTNESNDTTFSKSISYLFPLIILSMVAVWVFCTAAFSFKCFFCRVSKSFCCLRWNFWKPFSFRKDSNVMLSNFRSSTEIWKGFISNLRSLEGIKQDLHSGFDSQQSRYIFCSLLGVRGALSLVRTIE